MVRDLGGGLAERLRALSLAVYRRAHDIAEARGIILAASGKQFDPQVVDAFRTTEAQFIQIHDSFPDD